MKEPDKRRKERIKLALIPVLLLVLAAIVFWPASAPEDDAKIPQLRTTPVKGIAAEHNPSAAAKSLSDHPWPTVELSKVIAVNPFEKPTPIKEMLGELPEPEPPMELTVADEEGRLQTIEANPAEAREPKAVAPPEEPEREVIDVATIATLQAIIDSDHGRSALIDSRIFRVGDLMNDQYRITEISSTAVFVEWIEP